jgi:hypothetical protein
MIFKYLSWPYICIPYKDEYNKWFRYNEYLQGNRRSNAKLCIRVLRIQIMYSFAAAAVRYFLNYYHRQHRQQILYIIGFIFCKWEWLCWYCQDHIDLLYDDHISFQLKWQLMQLFNWIEWISSTLCLWIFKPSADLQLGQQ